MPNPSAKIIAQCEPITKTDGAGRLLIVGYRRKRKPSSRKRTEEFWLARPVPVEDAGKKVLVQTRKRA